MKKRITDKERLDWANRNIFRAGYGWQEAENWGLDTSTRFYEGKTIRQAINAAMRAERGKEKA